MGIYYSVFFHAEWSASDVTSVDAAAIEHLMGVRAGPPEVWPDDEYFSKDYCRTPFYPWAQRDEWPHASVQLIPLHIRSVVSAYRLIFHGQALDLPRAYSHIEFFRWLARFIAMDGPIGLFFSPDMAKEAPDVFSVYGRKLHCTRADGQRVLYEGLFPDSSIQGEGG